MAAYARGCAAAQVDNLREEYGQARPRYKKGDKVRVVREGDAEGGSYHEAKIGEVFTVTDVFDDEVHTNIWYFYPYEIEPVAAADPAPLQLEAGKYYRTRDGRKVGPMRRWSDEARHRWEADDDDLPYIWADDGTEIDSDIDDSADLVAEADEPPAQPQSTKEILDELEAWIAKQDAVKAAGKGGTDYGSTAGFTVPLFDEDDFDICGHRDNDDDIVQLSVSELTAALADSLKVARRVGKTIKRGDLVTLARPALVTGVHRYHASVQTDGGNYNLPLAALTAA